GVSGHGTLAYSRYGDCGDRAYVVSRDTTIQTGDLTGDGDSDDTVLSALDTRTGGLTSLCAADSVSVADGIVAWLRPETTQPGTGCPAGSLNSDGDTNDRVVQSWRPGDTSPTNLGISARAVIASDNWIAALVAEEDEGGIDLNHDGDT